jgi:hypothetical protein
MDDLFSYYFTNSGEIYYGYSEDFWTMFPSKRVIVPPHNLLEFNKLDLNNLTENEATKLAWIINRSTIVKEFKHNELTKKQSNKNAAWSTDEKSKYVFIIGAGASAYGIRESERENLDKFRYWPPLGNQLFEERFEPLYNQYDGVRLSLYYLRSKGQDIEELFENEWKEIEEFGNDDLLQRHLSIQLYIANLLRIASSTFCDGFNGKTLFEPLCDHLSRIRQRNKNEFKDSQFTIISFNQDSILEFYLEKYFRCKITTIEDYAKGIKTPFNFFKPHGSWNWGWPFKNVSTFRKDLASDLFENETNYFNLYFELLGDYNSMIDWDSYGIEKGHTKNELGKFSVNKNLLELYPESRTAYYFPGILLPYRDKDEFTMPTKHYFGMRSKLSEAEKIIIIGWKGNEQSFNRILANQATKVKEIVICDPNPEIVKQNLKPFIDKLENPKIIVYSSFENFIDDGLKREIT